MARALSAQLTQQEFAWRNHPAPATVAFVVDVHDSFETELRGTKIPGFAWLIAGGAIACGWMFALAIPGPMVTGCLNEKSCTIWPQAPMLVAMATAMLGTAVSTWFGRIPSNMVAGWAAAVAALATVGLAIMPMMLGVVDGRLGARDVLLGSLLVLLPIWLGGVGLGVLASAVRRHG